MKDPKVINRKVVFGPCRLSYVHLLEKHSFDGDNENGKYSVSILIPKKEKKTITAIEEAIENAKKEFATNKWGGKAPKKLSLPLNDGDDEEKDDEAYAGHYYINAKSNTKPGVVDKDFQPITDEEDVYSGMWGMVSVSFYGYDKGVNKGIAAAINNVMKTKDDSRLGGDKESAESDFEGFDDDDDDDDI